MTRVENRITHAETIRRVKCKCSLRTGKACYACTRIGNLIDELEKEGWVGQDCLYYLSSFYQEKFMNRSMRTCKNSISKEYCLHGDDLYTPQYNVLQLCEKHFTIVRKKIGGTRIKSI